MREQQDTHGRGSGMEKVKTGVGVLLWLALVALVVQALVSQVAA